MRKREELVGVSNKEWLAVGHLFLSRIILCNNPKKYPKVNFFKTRWSSKLNLMLVVGLSASLGS